MHGSSLLVSLFLSFFPFSVIDFSKLLIGHRERKRGLVEVEV